MRVFHHVLLTSARTRGRHGDLPNLSRNGIGDKTDEEQEKHQRDAAKVHLRKLVMVSQSI